MGLDNSTTTVDLNPPVNPAPDTLAMFGNQVIVAIVISIVIAAIIFLMIRRNSKSNRDIDPSLDDLMSDTYDPNKAAVVMMLLTLPLVIGIMAGLNMLFIDLGIGLSLIVGSITFTLMPYFVLKQSSRDKSRNKKKMNGTLYTKSGKKRKYYFGNVDFDAERGLNAVDREKILNTKGMDEETLDKLHPIPAIINDKYNVYFLFEAPFADAIAWMDDEEFDYYGSYTTKADGPVLKEVTKIQRVNTNPNDDEDLVNEFVFVFWVMFDDAHASKRQAGLQLVDLTDNQMFAGLTKAVSADRKVIAGEINAKSAELLQHQEHSIDFDDVTKSVGRKKALEFVENESNLTNIDLSTLKVQVSLFTALILAALCGFIGYFIGVGG